MLKAQHAMGEFVEKFRKHLNQAGSKVNLYQMQGVLPFQNSKRMGIGGGNKCNEDSETEGKVFLIKS